MSSEQLDIEQRGNDQVQIEQSKVDQINERLNNKTDWEVELAVSPYDQHLFLRVYRIQRSAKPSRCRVILGAMQLDIDPNHLVASAAIADACYRLGVLHGSGS